MATAGTRQVIGALEDFVAAFGYRTEAHGGFLPFEDRGGITPVVRKIVGGLASSITRDEIIERQPEFVVVNDNPTAERVQDLLDARNATASRPELIGLSRFL